MLVWLALVMVAMPLTGCATTGKAGEGLSGMKDKALEAIGFKRPEIPESAKPARRMSLRISSSSALNLDMSGQSLSLVVRIYKLRGTTAFLNAPYEVFGDATKEKMILGADLVDAQELVVFPGRQRLVDERWNREATYVGVVGLFRRPAPQQWRYAFELEPLQTGQAIVLGAHACTLSVASGVPVGEPPMLGTPSCQEAPVVRSER